MRGRLAIAPGLGLGLAFAVALAVVVGGFATAGGTPGKPGGVVTVEHRDPMMLPSRGPANALVTVELWFAPFQSSRQPVVKYLENMQARHPSRIRLVYRIVTAGAQVRLPYAAIYAFTEGKFFEFMEAVNALRQLPDDKTLADIAKKIGLDSDRMFAVISRPPPAYDKVLKANEERRQQRFRGSPQLPNVLFNGRLTRTHTSALGPADLDREDRDNPGEYQIAKAAAEDLLDHGIAVEDLPAAFEQVPNALPEEIIVQPGAIDEGSDDLPEDPVLADPPLAIAGWPYVGSTNADTTIIVLCSPTSMNCRPVMNAAENIQRKYPKLVRVVWTPYFKVDAEDAADLSLLSDAAFCAEKVGTTLEGRLTDSNVFDDEESPGWRWVKKVLAEGRKRDLDPEKLIEKTASTLHVDKPAFAACRAQRAGMAVSWIEAARHAGVRATPSTVVGGRIYGPITDYATLQLLVEAELAPGWLAPSWMQPAIQK